MVAAWKFCVSRAASQIREQQVAKKSKKTAKTKESVRREYTKADVKGVASAFKGADAGGQDRKAHKAY